LTSVGLYQAEDAVERRGLARAVVAEQGEYRTTPNEEGNTADGGRLAAPQTAPENLLETQDLQSDFGLAVDRDRPLDHL